MSVQRVSGGMGRVRKERRREAGFADLQIFAEVAYQMCNILGFLTLRYHQTIRQIRTLPSVRAVSVC